MVFGWKKKTKITETKITQPLTEKNLELSQVKDVVEDIMQLRKETLLVQVKTFRNKIVPNLEQILKIIKSLEKDELTTEDIDRHLKSIVMRGKKQVVSIIKKEADTKLIKIDKFEDVLTFDTQLSQILKKMGDVLGRQTRVIHIFAKKHAVKLKIVLTALNEDSSEIHKLIDNINTQEEKCQKILESVNQIQNDKQEQEKTTNKITTFEQSKIELSSKIDEQNNAIKKLKETDEFSQYEKIIKKIDLLSVEKDQIKNKIDIQFTKISRPLSKYSYISSLDRDQKKILESLVSNPFEVLTWDNKSNIITILESVLRGVQSGNVSVKDTEKSIQQINETSKMLDEFLNVVSNFGDKKSKLKKELKVFDAEKLNQYENTVKKTENDITDLEIKIRNLNNELNELRTLIPNLKNNVENWLKEISATRYKINM